MLQPRVSYHLYAATRSRFAGLLAASGGIDPYSNAVSDTYMDLFGLGTFTGKGIYDVDAFEAAVGHTFPDNAILSHDLIEGNYARCGLVTDVELFDDFPPRYHAYAMREHRWARGDWQLLPWLGRNVPTPAAEAEPAAARRALEGFRQPPPEPRPAEPGGPARPGLDGLARLALALDLLRAGGPVPADRPDAPRGVVRVDQGTVDRRAARRRAQHAGDGGAVGRSGSPSWPTRPGGCSTRSVGR